MDQGGTCGEHLRNISLTTSKSSLLDGLDDVLYCGVHLLNKASKATILPLRFQLHLFHESQWHDWRLPLRTASSSPIERRSTLVATPEPPMKKNVLAVFPELATSCVHVDHLFFRGCRSFLVLFAADWYWSRPSTWW